MNPKPSKEMTQEREAEIRSNYLLSEKHRYPTGPNTATVHGIQCQKCASYTTVNCAGYCAGCATLLERLKEGTALLAEIDSLRAQLADKEAEIVQLKKKSDK